MNARWWNLWLHPFCSDAANPTLEWKLRPYPLPGTRQLHWEKLIIIIKRRSYPRAPRTPDSSHLIKETWAGLPEPSHPTVAMRVGANADINFPARGMVDLKGVVAATWPSLPPMRKKRGPLFSFPPFSKGSNASWSMSWIQLLPFQLFPSSPPLSPANHSLGVGWEKQKKPRNLASGKVLKIS